LQNNNQQTQSIEEDEIDLRELFRTIAKNKKLILLITTIITLLAATYAFMKTPIYEVKSNIQIGYIGKNLLIEQGTLTQTLTLMFKIGQVQAKGEEFISEVSNIESNKKLKNFIEVTTIAISNEEALKKNKEVLSYINSRYKIKLEQYKLKNKNQLEAIHKQIINLENLETKNVQQDLKDLKDQTFVNLDKKIKFYRITTINSLNNRIKYTSKKLKQYTKAINEIYNQKKSSKITAISAMQVLNYQNLILNSKNSIENLKVRIKDIIINTIPSLEDKRKSLQSNTLRKLNYKLTVEIPNKKEKLEKQITQLKFNLSALNIQSSQIIGDYIIYDYPTKPKKKLIIVVAFITGLILSIFLVFFLAFLRSMKEEAS